MPRRFIGSATLVAAARDARVHAGLPDIDLGCFQRNLRGLLHDLGVLHGFFSFLAYNLLLPPGLKIHDEFSFNFIDPKEQQNK
ncbi:MAG: hypothetical protein V1853_01640 [bacterium]